MSFCVVNVTLLESCVYVLPARGRTVGGACPPSPLSAYPDPLRHARRPGKSGTVVRRPPGARVDSRHFVFDYLRLPIVTVACSTPGLYRTLPTYRSVGASAMRCGGWRVVTSFTRVTFSFSTRAWPAVGSAGTRRILSSKTVTFAGFFGSRRGPRSRGAGESSRGAVRVTFRLRFVTGESPDLACTLVAAAQRTTLL